MIEKSLTCIFVAKSYQNFYRSVQKICISLAFGSVVLLVLNGCAGWFQPPAADPVATSIVENFIDTNSGPERMKAIGRLDIKKGGRNRRARIALALEMSDKLRVELLSFIGQPLARIAAVNGQLQYQEPGSSGGRIKTVSSTELKRFLGVELTVRDLVAVLTGHLPEMGLARDSIAVMNSEADMVLLKNRWHQVMAKVGWDRDFQRPAVYERYDAEGHIRYKVSWMRWETIEGLEIPSAWKFENGQGDWVDLRLSRIYLPEMLPDKLFRLERPN